LFSGRKTIWPFSRLSRFKVNGREPHDAQLEARAAPIGRAGGEDPGQRIGVTDVEWRGRAWHEEGERIAHFFMAM